MLLLTVAEVFKDISIMEGHRAGALPCFCLVLQMGKVLQWILIFLWIQNSDAAFQKHKCAEERNHLKIVFKKAF